MRSKVDNQIYVLLFVLNFAAASYAQPATAPEWNTITSSGEEFSVTVPAGYLIHKDPRTDKVTVFGSGGGTSFEVAFQKTWNAKEWFKERADIGLPRKGQTSQVDIDEARARLYRYQSPKIFRISISLATKKGLYQIDLAAPSSGNETLARIMASLRLKDKSMLKDSTASVPVAVATVSAEILKSSDIVKAAMHRKQTEPVEVAAARVDYLPEDEVVYSQPVILAEKVRPTYNDRARMDKTQGTILARVLFKGNGNIGKITIIKGLPSGLNEQVIQAAKKIKFVPAQINGVPVDAEKTVEYGFEIY